MDNNIMLNYTFLRIMRQTGMFPSIIAVGFLWSCKKAKIQKSDLISGNDVWILNTAEIFSPKNTKTMTLKFKTNGYAYERSTILKY